MAKAARQPKKASDTPKASDVPEFSVYTIKRMDRQLWERFVRKVHGEGRTVRWTIEHMVTSYANGSYRIETAP